MCEDLQPGSGFDDQLAAYLDRDRMLVSARCWLAAYNRASGFWMVEDRPPFHPELVTVDANEMRDGRLVGSSKGRGLCHGRKVIGAYPLRLGQFSFV